jgi:phosphotransferase system IIA component
LIGVFGGDTVTLTQAGTFASKNVGSGIAVSASDSLGGASAGDYVLVDPTGLTANITPATLTVSGTAVGSKVYDGSTTASLNGGTLIGLYGADAVTLTQAGAFASKNAGTGIAVTATDSLGGASAGDYLLIEPTRLLGDITPASLTVIDTSVGPKLYDGNTVAMLSGGRLVGLLGGDMVSLTQAGNFASAHIGSGIAVTADDSLGGANASDYTIIEPTGLTGSIVAASGPVVTTPQSVLAAEAEIESAVLDPAVGDEPQTLSASTTIDRLPNPGTQPDVVVKVSMNIGANGTLTIENGGLRLPDHWSVGTQ